MKKLPRIILSWRKKLAFLLYPIDFSELIRKQLGSISTSDINYNKEADEEKRFEARCQELIADEVLSEVIDKVMAVQADYIARYAKDMDSVAFGRGSINGASLIREELQRLASLDAERKLMVSEYDKYDVI